MGMSKKYFIMLAVVISSGSLYGCAQKENKKGSNTIKFVSPQTQIADKIEAYAKSFEEQNPGYHIELQINANNYEENVVFAFAAGDASADVLEVHHTIDTPEFKDYLQPLGNSGDLKEKYRYLEAVDDVVYTLPLGVDIEGGILYDKSVLNNVGVTNIPDTPEALTEILYKVQEQTDIIPLYTHFTDKQMQKGWNALATSLDGEADYRTVLLEMDHPFSKNTEFYRTYKILYDAVREGMTEVNTGGLGSWEEANNLLLQHKIAATIVPAEYAYDIWQQTNQSQDYIYSPFVAKDGSKYLYIGTNNGLAISKECKNVELATKWIDYLYNDTDYLAQLGCDYVLQENEDYELISKLEQQNIKVVEMKNLSQEEAAAFEKRDNESELALSNGYFGCNLIDKVQYEGTAYDELCDSWNDAWVTSK